MSDLADCRAASTRGSDPARATADDRQRALPEAHDLAGSEGVMSRQRPTIHGGAVAATEIAHDHSLTDCLDPKVTSRDLRVEQHQTGWIAADLDRPDDGKHQRCPLVLGDDHQRRGSSLPRGEPHRVMRRLGCHRSWLHRLWRSSVVSPVVTCSTELARGEGSIVRAADGLQMIGALPP